MVRTWRANETQADLRISFRCRCSVPRPVGHQDVDQGRWRMNAGRSPLEHRWCLRRRIQAAAPAGKAVGCRAPSRISTCELRRCSLNRSAADRGDTLSFAPQCFVGCPPKRSRPDRQSHRACASPSRESRHHVRARRQPPDSRVRIRSPLRGARPSWFLPRRRFRFHGERCGGLFAIPQFGETTPTCD